MKIIPCQRTYQSLFLALFGGKHSCLLVHQAGRDLLLMWVGLVPRGWRQTHQLETNWYTASFFGQGGLLLSSNTYKQSLCDRQQWHEGRQNTAAHLLSLTCNTRGEATRRRNPGAIMRWHCAELQPSCFITIDYVSWGLTRLTVWLESWSDCMCWWLNL